MAVDIYSTIYMEALIREKPIMYTFLKDRYFSDSSVFNTEKVFVDYDDGEGNLLAPFVIPRKGSVPIMREGYETYELTPAYIAPSRPLTIDNLTRRMAGESIVSTMTPAERERQYLISDLDVLDRAITRREEWMAASTMLDNACTMSHIGDAADKPIDLTATYYDGTTNPGVFTPAEAWAIGTETERGTWYNDVAEQAASLAEAGREVTDLVVGSEVGELILSDPWVISMLDNRRIVLGQVDPRYTQAGVIYIGNLNFGGIPLDIFSYRGTYQERTVKGKTTTVTTNRFFPSTAALLAAPNTGRRKYGAVTQVELDHNTYTRTGERVPKHNVDVEHNTKETILTSRPIFAPRMKGQWRACRDVINI